MTYRKSFASVTLGVMGGFLFDIDSGVLAVFFSGGVSWKIPSYAKTAKLPVKTCRGIFTLTGMSV